jgi:hypothetical protein
MKRSHQLKDTELQNIVADIQQILYRDSDGEWNRNAEWSSNTLERISEIFEVHDLVPDDED